MSDTATIYLSIGNSDDKLTQARWSEFHGLMTMYVRNRAHKVYGSWCSIPTDPWQNACIAFEMDPAEIPILKSELRDLAATFDQDSVAWAETSDTVFVGPGEVLPA